MLLAVALSGCAAALHEPPPVSALARSGGDARSAADLLAAAGDAWSQRASDPEAASRAESLYLEAAAADGAHVDGLLGAVRAKAFLIQRERRGEVRTRLAVSAVQAGQWCERRAPDSPACAYALGVALGLQARERPSTAEDGLRKMVALLRRAASADPRLDEAGPHRILAYVYLGAPAWPVGPGDPEAGLKEARAAAALFPEHVENQLVLAEALAKNDRAEEARAAYQRALTLAEAATGRKDPDAEGFAARARKGLGW
jgi:hypothetical protein